MSIYKRGSVYWYEFRFEGRRHQASTGLTNKRAAFCVEAMRKTELAEGRAGIIHRKSAPTFEEFAHNEFLPWSKKQHESKPKTQAYYRVSTKALLALFGKLPLDCITPRDVERFKVTRAERVSSASTNRDLAALRFMLNFAIRQGYIFRNPVQGVRFLPEGPGMMRIVSHEVQRRYMKAASLLLRDVATLIVETGMRPGEVFTTCLENVHLNRRYLFVPFGKTVFARRNVPLTEVAVSVLKRRVAQAKGLYLFPHRRDVNRPMGTIQKGHEEALRKAGINPPFRLYDFRHTYGSRSAMAGVELPTLKENMGHGSISITMRYIHPTPEHKQEAVRKLERYNAEELIKSYESHQESLQKSLQ
ncbi:MAG: tyrosine-type recombinase/integrase [Terriglobia bacterium]